MSTPLALLGEAIASGTGRMLEAQLVNRRRQEALDDFEAQKRANEEHDKRYLDAMLERDNLQIKAQKERDERLAKAEKDRYEAQKTVEWNMFLKSHGVNPNDAEAVARFSRELNPEYKRSLETLLEQKALAKRMVESGIKFDAKTVLNADGSPESIRAANEVMSTAIPAYSEKLQSLTENKEWGSAAKANLIIAKSVELSSIYKQDTDLAEREAQITSDSVRNSLLLNAVRSINKNVTSLESPLVTKDLLQMAMDNLGGESGLNKQAETKAAIARSAIQQQRRAIGARADDLRSFIETVPHFDFTHANKDAVNSLVNGTLGTVMPTNGPAAGLRNPERTGPAAIIQASGSALAIDPEGAFLNTKAAPAATATPAATPAPAPAAVDIPQPQTPKPSFWSYAADKLRYRHPIQEPPLSLGDQLRGIGWEKPEWMQRVRNTNARVLENYQRKN